MRYLFNLVTIWCFPLFLLAQEKDRVWQQAFSLNETAAAKPVKFLLVKTTTDESPESLADKGFQVMRQLSGRVFIIKWSSKTEIFAYAVPSSAHWKLSPTLLSALRGNDHPTAVMKYSIFTRKDSLLKKQLAALNDPSIKIGYSSDLWTVISASADKLLSKVLPLESVEFVEAERSAKEELSISALDLSLNKINTVHSEWPYLSGAGMRVSLKEQKPDTTDIDLKGRYISSAMSAPNVSGHATIIATMIAGAGNSYYTGKGVAGGASFLSSDFSRLVPDAEADYKQYNITVQNHSYGTAVENYYGADAMAYDKSTMTNPLLLHIFSAGNSGLTSSSSGLYSGMAGWANLTGSFKMSKNSISVGAVDSLGVVSAMSSRGPAYDGRLKPELVAFGQDGSSGAAALVSGIALLCQQAYKERHGGQVPDAALVKAVLANSADDVGPKGIDFLSGFGNINAYRAVKTMEEGNFFSGSISNGEAQRFRLNVPVNARKLKITLAWIDPEAKVNAYKALVNDLDLELLNSESGELSRPWVLNPYPLADSLMQAAVHGRDSLNNIEQISLEIPGSQHYEIVVNATHETGSQQYYIAWQWDDADHFKWTYPTANDNLLPGHSSVLRWETSLTGRGELQYSPDAGSDWKVISGNINLSDYQYRWAVPDSFKISRLRMVIAGKIIPTDSFTISAPLTLSLTFNCADSLEWTWNKVSASGYVLYQMGPRYLEPVGIYKDTSAIIQKSPNTSTHYAVAPLLGVSTTGIKSYALNYNTQGIGCYVEQFLVDDEGSRVLLQFSLSAILGVEKVTVQKAEDKIFRDLKAYQPVNHQSYRLYDSMLKPGINTYRIKISFSDGRVIYSEQESVYHFGSGDYIIFPNPIAANQPLNILSKEPENSLVRCYSVEGRILWEKELKESIEELRLPLSRGIHFLEIIKAGKRQIIQKLIIY